MCRLKQGLAFPLYATVVWLLWVAGQQIGIDGLVRLLFGMLLLALAFWMYSVWRREEGVAGHVATTVSLVAVVAALALAVTSVRLPEPAVRVADSASVPFVEDEIAAIAASGRALFVNMTAAWWYYLSRERKSRTRHQGSARCPGGPRRRLHERRLDQP